MNEMPRIDVELTCRRSIIMEIVRDTELAASAAKRWKKQYFYDGEWCNSRTKNYKEIYNNLRDFGSHPTPGEVEKIIGNNSWTEVRCYVCDGILQKAIRFHKPEEDSRVWSVCLECLEKAVNLLDPNRESIRVKL